VDPLLHIESLGYPVRVATACGLPVPDGLYGPQPLPLFVAGHVGHWKASVQQRTPCAACRTYAERGEPQP